MLVHDRPVSIRKQAFELRGNVSDSVEQCR
jgi:hypothetical protein